MFLKVSKGTIADDTSFAKSKVPFASTIATFHARSLEPAMVVLFKNFHMGFSGDAQIKEAKVTVVDAVVLIDGNSCRDVGRSRPTP